MTELEEQGVQDEGQDPEGLVTMGQVEGLLASVEGQTYDEPRVRSSTGHTMALPLCGRHPATARSSCICSRAETRSLIGTRRRPHRQLPAY